MEITDVLQRTSLFGGLADKELDQILPLCRRETYPQGFLVGREGDEAKRLYIVETGCVALEMTIRWGPGGTAWQWPMEVATEGELLGWSALVKPHILTASFRTLAPTSLIAMDGAALRGLFMEQPRIGWLVMEETARIIASRLKIARRTAAQSVAIFSHDLKTPLAAVENFNRVILGGYAGPLTTDQREMLERNSQRVGRLLALLDDLMEASQIENGLISPEFCATPMTPLVVKAMALVQETATIKGLRLSVEMPEDLGEIYGAPKRLEQVMVNLLCNAVKFTPLGGSIVVRAINRNHSVQVEVVDTGIGVSPDEQTLCFADCYRGQAEDVNTPGTGMGLAIARRIIEAHGGYIWVESPPRGQEIGSCFAFAVPRVPPGTGRLWSWWTDVGPISRQGRQAWKEEGGANE